ncbi:MAG: hypothetical protein ABEK17_01210 [Candidatus Aenigmatarchaeota archaeon]
MSILDNSFSPTVLGEYLIQIWILSTALSLVLRFIFTRFKGTYDKITFRISLVLGFLFGLLFWISGSFTPKFFSYIVKLPPFYLFSILLWSFFITWSSWKFGGNAIVGSTLLAVLTLFLSVSSVYSLQFTGVSKTILFSARYQWLSFSIFLSILFLIFFWVNDTEE